MPHYVKETAGRYAVFFDDQPVGLVQRIHGEHHSARWRAYTPAGRELRAATFDGTYRTRRLAAEALSRREGLV